MSPKTNYLITGAGRGLGLAMSKIMLSRPNTCLIAFVRDPAAQAELDSITLGANSSLLKVKYDASDLGSAGAAVATLQQDHDINHLNVVIANAGICSYFGPAVSTPTEYITKEFQINTLGPILLFQAVAPLLLKAKGASDALPPKFFAISSLIGSTSQIPNNPQVSVLPYGVSKAGLNHALVKFHVDFPDLIVGVVTPGRTRTGFSRDAVRAVGPAGTNTALSFHNADESAEGLVKRIDEATREGDSGRFFDWADGELTW